MSQLQNEESSVTLDSGRIVCVCLREFIQGDEVYEIRTPNAIARVRGTVFIVEVARRPAQVQLALSGRARRREARGSGIARTEAGSSRAGQRPHRRGA